MIIVRQGDDNSFEICQEDESFCGVIRLVKTNSDEAWMHDLSINLSEDDVKVVNEMVDINNILRKSGHGYDEIVVRLLDAHIDLKQKELDDNE